MNDNRMDITFTVKASVANGRKLFRDLLTGQIYWEPAEAPAHSPADAAYKQIAQDIDRRVFEDAPAPTPKGKKRGKV